MGDRVEGPLGYRLGSVDGFEGQEGVLEIGNRPAGGVVTCGQSSSRLSAHAPGRSSSRALIG